MRSIFFALALLLAPAFALAQPTQHYRSVGWWDIVYFPNAEGCAALAEFENGVVFLIGLDTSSGNLALEVGILNTAWTSIQPGIDYEVIVTFGNKGPWYLTMTGAQSDELFGLNAVWDAESDSAGRFVDEFMASLNMRWVYAGTELGDFSLKDSRNAFNTALACTEANLGRGSDPFGGSGGDPFGGAQSDPFR